MASDVDERWGAVLHHMRWAIARAEAAGGHAASDRDRSADRDSKKSGEEWGKAIAVLDSLRAEHAALLTVAKAAEEMLRACDAGQVEPWEREASEAMHAIRGALAALPLTDDAEGT